MKEIFDTYNEVVDFENSDVDGFLDSLEYSHYGLKIIDVLNKLKIKDIPFEYVSAFNINSDDAELCEFKKIIIKTEYNRYIEDLELEEGIILKKKDDLIEIKYKE